MNTSHTHPQRCGTVSIIGAPNAGKSTLMNKAVGAKISIVSRKVQTTRTRVLGIVPQGQTQIIFIDTPGVFRAKKTLEKAMVGSALDAAKDGDIVLHLVDVTRKTCREDNASLIQSLPKNAPVYLILNKVDAIAKADLLPLAKDLHERFDYDRSFMISALKGQGVNDLMSALADALPEGPWHYDEDQMTTTPMRMLAAEITREKIFQQLYQEIPYAVMVETEKWEPFDNGALKLHQIITVERDSQKAIILGKGGAQIKKIGQQAREELQDMLGQPVHVKLFVRVQEDWQERPETYQSLGLDHHGKA